jgi:hypothetical protein
MYVGGGAQPIRDWRAQSEIWKLRRDLTALAAQVAELTAALKARDEADDTALDLAGRWT